MISRRDFIGVSSLAVAGTACGTSPEAEAQPKEQQEPALPPSIAALKPMKDGVTPISVAERRARIEKARRLMGENGMQALMLASGTSLRYFTGLDWWPSERLLTVVIPATGAPFLVTPKFEEDRAMEQVREGPLGEGTTVLTWEEDESPFSLVARGLRDRGIATGQMGVEETVPFVFSDQVGRATPAIKLVSGTPVTAGCRAVKDAHELALMRHASAVTLAAYKAVYQALRDGMPQDEAQRLVGVAHRRLGYDGDASIQVGPGSALPHGSKEPQVIREGSILLIDGGCKVEGYSSDISRTFVIGKATDRMKQVFDVELRAQTAALRAARPGVECQAVDAAARKVIEDAGFGPGYRFFTHRVGHGIGMDGHEWPYLVRGNTLPLAPGMTFSDEPGIYIPGEFGVRLEDDMYITGSGAELFTPQSPSLEDPFGPAPA
jgi:Xaa-Pro dipeptidase